MTFLIADDSRSIRALMKLIVEELGHTIITTVDNGCAAVAEYNKVNADVVLMDVNMPLMNGIDALKIIKDNFEDAVVIMTTAQGAESIVTSAKQAGAAQYILKPITKRKLQEALEKIFPNTDEEIAEETSQKEPEASQKPELEATTDEEAPQINEIEES